MGNGDGIALFVGNSPEAVLLELAVHFTGCRLVFVPPEPGNSELEALIGRADVGMLVFDPAFEERTRRIAGGLGIPHVLSLGTSSSAEDVLAVASGLAGLELHEAGDSRHIATLLYTGGTTGMPKLVVHGSGYNAAIVKLSSKFTDDVSADPTLLIAALVTHTSGYVAFLVGVLTGHTIVLLQAFDAGMALSVMDSERVTGVMVVTPMLYELLDHLDGLPHRFPALRSLFYTGSAASPGRIRQAIERIGPVLHQLYGASENGVVTELTPQEHDLQKPESLTSCGRPGPGVEVELRDDEGKVVPVGQTGELYVRSRTVMDGYWKDTERRAEVLDDDGWFRSGDIAREDENGYLYLVDRARDIIVTGLTADNVYSRLLTTSSSHTPPSRTPQPSASPATTTRKPCMSSWYPEIPPASPTFAC